MKTRIIVEGLEGVMYWRAPIIEGRHANVELCSMRDYATDVSALEAGRRHVKRLFPKIEFEKRD